MHLNLNEHQRDPFNHSTPSARACSFLLELLDMTLLAVFALSLCLTEITSSRAGNEVAYKDGDIMIGGLTVWHTVGEMEAGHCGSLYYPGLAVYQAIIFAVEQINKDKRTHGLLPNTTLGYDIRDYCDDRALAVNITYDFIRRGDRNCCSLEDKQKRIAAIIGPFSSVTAILVGSLIEVSGIPTISPSASSVELSSPFYRHFYRTMPSDKWQVSAMADLIEHFNWTYIGAVGLDDSYGRNGLWSLQEEAARRGTFCIAFTEFIPRSNYSSRIESTLAEMERHKTASVVALWIFSGQAKAFLKRVAEKNIRRTWILSDGFTIADAPFLYPYSSLLDGALGINVLQSVQHEFQNYLRKSLLNAFRRQDSNPPFWKELWTRLNCSVSVNSSGETCFDDVVRQLGNSPHVSNTIDAVYVVAHAIDNLVYHSQEAQKPNQQNQSAVKLEDLNFYLKDVSFDGLMGKVEFDGMGDPIEASYEIFNFRLLENSTINDINIFAESAGTWNKSRETRLKIRPEAITWGNHIGNSAPPRSSCSEICPPGTRKSITSLHCCWKCIPCPQGTVSGQAGSTNCSACKEEEKPNDKSTGCEQLPTANVQWTDVSGLVMVILSAVCFLLTFLTFGVFIKYWNTPLAKASNRELSLLLLLSIACFFVVVLLSLAKPTHILCRITISLRFILYTLSVSILMLKTLKILVAFKVYDVPDWLKPFILNTKGQFITLFLFQVVEVILIVSWLSIDPPYQLKAVQPMQHIFLVCKPYGSAKGKAFLITIGCYLLLLSFLCAFYAYKARRIPENFHEGKFIGFSMYIMLISAVASYPVEFALEAWYVAVVVSATTLVNSLGLLICIFGPKMYVLLAHPEENTAASVGMMITQFSFGNPPIGSSISSPAPPTANS